MNHDLILYFSNYQTIIMIISDTFEVNAEMMSLFLEEVSRWHHEEFIMMFMDQVGWYKARDQRYMRSIISSIGPAAFFSMILTGV